METIASYVLVGVLNWWKPVGREGKFRKRTPKCMPPLLLVCHVWSLGKTETQVGRWSNVCIVNTSHTMLVIKFWAGLKMLVNCRKGGLLCWKDMGMREYRRARPLPGTELSAFTLLVAVLRVKHGHLWFINDVSQELWFPKLTSVREK